MSGIPNNAEIEWCDDSLPITILSLPYIFDSRLDMLQDLIWRLHHTIRWAINTR